MKWWHRWRADVWRRRAMVANAKAQLLGRLFSASQTNYCADKWHAAVCASVYANSVLKYHEDKSR